QCCGQRTVHHRTGEVESLRRVCCTVGNSIAVTICTAGYIVAERTVDASLIQRGPHGPHRLSEEVRTTVVCNRSSAARKAGAEPGSSECSFKERLWSKRIEERCPSRTCRRNGRTASSCRCGASQGCFYGGVGLLE